MGQGDERFRILLVDELGKAGFVTTNDAKTADAALTGVFSIAIPRATPFAPTLSGLAKWFSLLFGLDAREEPKQQWGNSQTYLGVSFVEQSLTQH